MRQDLRASIDSGNTGPSPLRRRVWRHPAAWLASRAFVVAFALGQLTRLLLSVLTGDAHQASLSAWVDVLLRGAAGDAAFAATLACGLLVVGALTHGRRPRTRVRQTKRAVGMGIAIFALLFIAVSEVLFWDEFTTRFNFIAVDYLIYTTEVIGNIRESYPVNAILAVVGAIALAVSVFLVRSTPVDGARPLRWWGRIALAALAVAGTALAARVGLAVHDSADSAAALRTHAALPELARNGPIAFIAALRDNALPFSKFYATVDPASVDALAGAWPRQPLARPVAFEGAARAPGSTPDGAPARRPKHLVLIQVESLSAEFLGAFGDRRELTPNMDRYAREGVLFTQLYAIGTRTVRGLEALSAGLPPLPGQSVVRRPDNAGLLTMGGVLRANGFSPQFLYGGYGMFDNMNAWFEGSGYRVRDRSDLPPDPARFGNVWGVADEHLFDEALATMDRESGSGRAFLHLMTTSNHRPYTYPDGRIDIPSKTGREGAVKYTDWAIGHFIEQARGKPWFDDTLFVIVADHCASVAGRTKLPPDRYHIPAIFYSPSHLKPGTVDHLASQIDLVPTLLGWFGFDHGGRFLGQDLFGPDVEQRAFLANYQEIGMLVPADDGGRDMVVLSPRRRVGQFHIDAGGTSRAVPIDPVLAQRVVARFQQADGLLSGNRYRMIEPEPRARPITMNRQPDASGEKIHDAARKPSPAAS